jgi:hypothetical protein
VQPDSSSSSSSTPVQLTVQHQQQQQQQQPNTAGLGGAAAEFADMPGAGSSSSSSVASNVRAIQQSNLARDPALQLMLAQAGTSHQVRWHDKVVTCCLNELMRLNWGQLLQSISMYSCRRAGGGCVSSSC